MDITELINYRPPLDVLIVLLAVGTAYWLCRAFKNIENFKSKEQWIRAIKRFNHHFTYGLLLMISTYTISWFNEHEKASLFVFWFGFTLVLDDLADLMAAVTQTLAKFREWKKQQS